MLTKQQQENFDDQVEGRDYKMDFNTHSHIVHLEPGQSITIFVKEPMDVMVHRLPIEVLQDLQKSGE